MALKKRIVLFSVLVFLLSSCSFAVPQTNSHPGNSLIEPTVEKDQEGNSLINIQQSTPESLPGAVTPPLSPSQTPSEPFNRQAEAPEGLTGLNYVPEGVNPYTGLELDNPEILHRKPVLIKVSNYPRSGRPHAGLSYADIVFEYYIGEQMNRFLALYYGNDSPKIGPLRSGRMVDPQLTSMYGGVLVYGSADVKVETFIESILPDQAFTHLDTPCPAICGQDTHSIAGVFVNSEEITKYIIEEGLDNTPPEPIGMVFDQNVTEGDHIAVNIGMEYSFRDRGEWNYDPESGLYDRWIEEDDNYSMIPLVDRVNNEQIRFANVIVIYATYFEYAPTLHNIFVWDNTQGKDAYIFRDAQMYEATWKVRDHYHPIEFYNKYGMPVVLKPGNTWIILVGDHSSIWEAEPGSWEIQFDLP